jgi:GAF domain-containing protein
LDLQSTEPLAFDGDDILALQTLADQVAMTISNARLFQQSQERLDAMQRAYAEYDREAWTRVARERGMDQGYRYRDAQLSSAGRIWRPEMALAVERDQTVVQGPDPHDAAGSGVAAVPIRIRDQIVGVIDARKREQGGRWSTEEVQLLETLVARLGEALDGARLYQETQRREAEQRLIGEVTAEMRRTLDVDAVLQAAIREIGDALDFAQVEVRMGRGASQDREGHT